MLCCVSILRKLLGVMLKSYKYIMFRTNLNAKSKRKKKGSGVECVLTRSEGTYMGLCGDENS